ncbi:MAG: TspO/MBR family protein [Clostridia bacterium]
MWNKIKTYFYFIALSLGVGALSALFTMGNMDIYDDIITPPLSPPSFLFPIVWTVLYILMGISGAIIYKEDKKKLDVFYTQLAVNFAWSILFFNLRMFLLSSLWLLWLIVLVIKMIRQFKKVDTIAAYLQYPYLIWLIFALYLNAAIYILNK